MSNGDLIAKSTWMNMTDVTLSYDNVSCMYVVQYTGDKFSFESLIEAVDEYIVLVSQQYDDYR